MNNNLFVSYDLHAPGQNYEAVVGAIKELGDWAKVHYSLWYVKSTLNASEASARVWKAMDTNDRLIVVDATNNNGSWYNLTPEVSKFMKDNWHR